MPRLSIATRLLTVQLALLITSSTTVAAPYFTSLGGFPGSPGNFLPNLSNATDISADGQVVVGQAENSDGNKEAFRWTLAGGMIGLGDVPGDGFRSSAEAISGDGSTIVGNGSGPGGTDTAFVWTSPIGLTPLTNLPSADNSRVGGVSSDGSIIVGTSVFNGVEEPVKWTSGVPSALGVDIQIGRASAVSGDGTVTAGISLPESTFEITTWSDATGETHMGLAGEVASVSFDGSVIVGTADAGLGAFRWESGAGFDFLGFGSARDVTADGSLAVGSDSGDAVIWDASNGVRNLADLLTNDFGLDLTGWSLRDISGVSDDGLTFVGTGTNPSGSNEAWIAHIPEPSTALLLGMGLVGLCAISQSSGRNTEV